MRNSPEDLRPQIQRLLSLVESVDERLARLEASHNRQGQNLVRQNEQIAKVEEAQTKLNDLLSRQSELLARLEEAQIKHSEQLGRLDESYSRQVKQLTRLEEEQCRQGKQLGCLEAGVARPAGEAGAKKAGNGHGHGHAHMDREAMRHRFGRTTTSRLAARRQARMLQNGGAQIVEVRAPADPRQASQNAAGDAGSVIRRESRREARRTGRRDEDGVRKDGSLDTVQGEVRQLGDRLNRLIARLDRMGQSAAR